MPDWNTTHIVLGSNLARLPWVKALLVANKAIFIDRSLTGRAAFDQHIAISERIATDYRSRRSSLDCPKPLEDLKRAATRPM